MSLTLTLSLAAGECIRGESVLFNVALVNGDKVPYLNMQPMDQHAALVLIAIPKNPDSPDPKPVLEAGEIPHEAITGAASLILEREGIHRHGSDLPERITLQPGQSLTESGDLLEWLAELKPGLYSIWARFKFRPDYLLSAPATLQVLPAAPAAAVVAALGRSTQESPFAASWVHTETPKQQLLFYQLQSSALPSVPKRGIRTAPARQVMQLAVATRPSILCRYGHLVWLDQNKLRVGVVDTATAKAAAVLDPRKPPAGTLLRSPLSRQDGSVLIPIASEKADSLTILQVAMSGDAKAHSIDLGMISPIGAYSCLWDVEQALNFIWTAPKGREIQHASMLLENPIAGAPVRTMFVASEPVTWLEGYLDMFAALTDQPAFEHNATDDDRKMTGPVRPKINVWMLFTRRSQLVCARYTEKNNKEKTETLLDTEGKDLRVIGSIVNRDFAWCLLLADQSNTLYYASTLTEKIAPVVDSAGQSIALDQQPALMAANRSAVLPWVFLRYIDRKQNAVRFLKMEPAREKEPASPHLH